MTQTGRARVSETLVTTASVARVGSIHGVKEGRGVKRLLPARRKRTYAAGLIAAAALLGLGLALGTGQARSASGCKQVNGHVFDEHVEGGLAVGRMVGTISGRYEFTGTGGVGSDPGAPGNVVFATGNTRITTQEGELRWRESNVFDLANQNNFNNAILASVTGGTGAWAGASGHVILWGFFHTSTLTGELDYRGEICTG